MKPWLITWELLQTEAITGHKKANKVVVGKSTGNQTNFDSSFKSSNNTANGYSANSGYSGSGGYKPTMVTIVLEAPIKRKGKLS